MLPRQPTPFLANRKMQTAESQRRQPQTSGKTTNTAKQPNNPYIASYHTSIRLDDWTLHLQGGRPLTFSDVFKSDREKVQAHAGEQDNHWGHRGRDEDVADAHVLTCTRGRTRSTPDTRNCGEQANRQSTKAVSGRGNRVQLRAPLSRGPRRESLGKRLG